MVNKWKWLFIIGCTLLVYFGAGIWTHARPQDFFIGVIVGAVVCYLFFRYRDEAAANINTNTNTQNVHVNVSQAKVAASGFSEQQLEAISEIVSNMQNNKLLVSRNVTSLPEPQDELTQSERLAQLLRARRQGQNNV